MTSLEKCVAVMYMLDPDFKVTVCMDKHGGKSEYAVTGNSDGEVIYDAVSESTIEAAADRLLTVLRAQVEKRNIRALLDLLDEDGRTYRSPTVRRVRRLSPQASTRLLGDD